MRVLLLAVFMILTLSPALAGKPEGKEAYFSKDWPRALAELRPLADGGDGEAMVLLGNMYNDGSGVVRDHKTAMDLYLKAASQENVDAMLAIATMNASGIGVAKNWPEAIVWYEKAARLNSQVGQFFLGMFYFQGEPGKENGIPSNKKESYKWFRLASMGNENPQLSQVSKDMALKLAEILSSADVTAAEVEIKAWKSTAP